MEFELEFKVKCHTTPANSADRPKTLVREPDNRPEERNTQIVCDGNAKAKSLRQKTVKTSRHHATNSSHLPATESIPHYQQVLQQNNTEIAQKRTLWNGETVAAVIVVTLCSIQLIPTTWNMIETHPAAKTLRRLLASNSPQKTPSASKPQSNHSVKFVAKSWLAKTPKRGDRIGSYQVASPFGLRPQPCAVCSKYHNGVDVGTPMGTPLLAIALPGDAIKVSCRDTQLGGLTATIKSESIPDKSFAAVHLSSCFSGTHKAGAIFALTGNSGQATTGPHLHWVEKVNGVAVPPQRGYVEWVITGKIPTLAATQTTSATSSTSTKYGHFAYKEAPLSDLVDVGNGEKLRHAAAVEFRKMVAAATTQRIALVPLSGFRDRTTQHYLFFDKAAQRVNS